MSISLKLLTSRSNVLEARERLRKAESLCQALKSDYIDKKNQPNDHDDVTAAWSLYHVANELVIEEKRNYDSFFAEYKLVLAEESKNPV